MKPIDLSQYICPRCSQAGFLFETKQDDSNYSIILCGRCKWWTWLKNLKTLTLKK